MNVSDDNSSASGSLSAVEKPKITPSSFNAILAFSVRLPYGRSRYAVARPYWSELSPAALDGLIANPSPSTSASA